MEKYRATTDVQDLARNAGTVLVGNGLSKALILIFELGLARHVGVEAYGLFSVAISLALVLAALSQLGWNFGVIQYLAAYVRDSTPDRRRALVTYGLLFVTTISTLIGLGVWLGRLSLASTVFAEPELARLLAVVAMLVPAEGINQYLSAVFRGLRRYRDHVAVLDLVRNALLVACLGLIYVQGWTVLSVLYLWLLGDVVAMAIATWRLRDYITLRGLRKHHEVARAAVRFSGPLIIWNILQKVANRVFLMVAAVALTSAEVGILAAAMRVVLVLTFFQSIASSVGQVEFATLHRERRHSELGQLFTFMAQSLLVVSLAVAVPMLVVPDLVMAAFGADWAVYGWVLWPLLVAKIVNVGSGPVGQLLIGCGKRGAMLAMTTLDVTLQIGAVLPAALIWGLPGAVVAEGTRIVAVVLVRQVVVHRLLAVRSIDARFLRLLVFGGLAIAAGLGLNWILPAVGSGAGGVFSIVVYGSLVVALARRQVEFLKALFESRVSRGGSFSKR